MVVIIWSVFSESSSHNLPLGFRYASYKVTIPKKLTPRHGQQDSKDVNYLLQIEGKSHVMHLRQKRNFVPKHFPVLTYSKKGKLQVDYPFIRNDCFYNGFIQGDPHSLVTLSTCLGGLRGLLHLQNETYEIEPVQASLAFQHVVYRLEKKEGDSHMMCGLTEEEQRHQEAMAPNKEVLAIRGSVGEHWWAHTRYADIAIVVEHQRYIKFDRNQTLTSLQILEIVHTANTFYKPLGIVISVIGLEIWSEKNLIVIPNELSSLLDNFNIWRRKTLNKHLPNDAAHLIVYKFYGQTAGLAFTGTICNSQWASAVEVYIDYSVSFFSVLFAHELGHNLGMNHDGEHCTCEQKSCIMAAFPEDVGQFSNCSYIDYFKHRNAHCLLIPTDPGNKFRFKYCGNKIVEKGEQCDCGSEVQCQLDPCCQSNCKFHSGVVCSIGQCCANCQYRPAGTVCRERVNACDLPEYCNGTSEWCPEDVYIQDGASCNDDAHCYHGNCASHNEQCKMLFGKKATVASEDCFRIINVQGDRFGNCGVKHGTYKKCKTNHFLCGRIQCDNVQKLPTLEEDSTIIQTCIGSSQCWGTDYHREMGRVDMGRVRDGTGCGTNMLCIDRQCKNISTLNYDCDIRKCHNRGICNNRKHCHCDYGWSPPYCIGKGFGGSIDSGPTSQDRSVVIAGTIIGTLIVLTATVLLGVYFRTMLRYQFRRLNSIVSSADSALEGNTGRLQN
ncbi:disintegrin and metalloproteinase domain-containing protein 20-like [Sceloporus undulatus]|uniref:disintegrin and metalloproteinase domain-containing protein 20-like n=1 Tax=Sceloporus undulatus TaxID=8520 RepID=UPI001C4AE3DA|nr:disintegrin and metalloproteinase domain-containing protein 20-like [Sceloporus undulatus]